MVLDMARACYSYDEEEGKSLISFKIIILFVKNYFYIGTLWPTSSPELRNAA